MSERALRGSRLGASSYESDENVDVVPRQQVPYDCPQGHRFTVPFSIEAEVPALWECRFCGAEATIANGDDPAPKQLKPPRTHWDMLLERRDVADLEELLQERLDLLRAERELAPAPTTAKKGAAAPKTAPASAKKAPAKAAVEKPAPAKSAPAKKAPAKKEQPASKAATKKPAAKATTAKTSAAAGTKKASKKADTAS